MMPHSMVRFDWRPCRRGSGSPASFCNTAQIIKRAVARRNGDCAPLSEALASRMIQICNAELVALGIIPLAARARRGRAERSVRRDGSRRRREPTMALGPVSGFQNDGNKAKENIERYRIQAGKRAGRGGNGGRESTEEEC